MSSIPTFAPRCGGPNKAGTSDVPPHANSTTRATSLDLERNFSTSFYTISRPRSSGHGTAVLEPATNPFALETRPALRPVNNLCFLSIFGVWLCFWAGLDDDSYDFSNTKNEAFRRDALWLSTGKPNHILMARGILLHFWPAGSYAFLSWVLTDITYIPRGGCLAFSFFPFRSFGDAWRVGKQAVAVQKEQIGGTEK